MKPLPFGFYVLFGFVLSVSDVVTGEAVYHYPSDPARATRALFSSMPDMTERENVLRSKGIFMISAKDIMILPPTDIPDIEVNKMEKLVFKRNQIRDFPWDRTGQLAPAIHMPLNQTALTDCRSHGDLTACYLEEARKYFLPRVKTSLVYSSTYPRTHYCSALVLYDLLTTDPDEHQGERSVFYRYRASPVTSPLVIAGKIVYPPADDQRTGEQFSMRLPAGSSNTLVCEKPKPDVLEEFFGLSDLGELHGPIVRILESVPDLPIVGLINVALLVFCIIGVFEYLSMPERAPATYDFDYRVRLTWAVRYWSMKRKRLVAVCYHLEHNLEDLLASEVITMEHYNTINRRRMSRGRIYGIRKLWKCIIENKTINLLFNVLPCLEPRITEPSFSLSGLEICASSGDEEPDNDTLDSSIIPLLMLLKNEKPTDPSLEDLLELNMITTGEYIRVVDRQVACGKGRAAQLLLRILESNRNKDKCLIWFASKVLGAKHELCHFTQ